MSKIQILFTIQQKGRIAKHTQQFQSMACFRLIGISTIRQYVFRNRAGGAGACAAAKGRKRTNAK